MAFKIPFALANGIFLLKGNLVKKQLFTHRYFDFVKLNCDFYKKPLIGLFFYRIK